METIENNSISLTRGKPTPFFIYVLFIFLLKESKQNFQLLFLSF